MLPTLLTAIKALIDYALSLNSLGVSTPNFKQFYLEHNAQAWSIANEIEFKYIQPEKERTYIPDFKTGKRNIYLEAKGKLDLDTRQKMVWFRDSHPETTVIFLFMNPDNKITKRSKTTYWMWAEANEFKWLDFRKDWLNDYKQLCTKL